MNHASTGNGVSEQGQGQPLRYAWLGTMGYAYPDWKGVFYPAKSTADSWLSFYARFFPCVEMNTTFHAIPSAERFIAWGNAVSEDFRFSLKMSRGVTHDKTPDQAVTEAKHFCELSQRLGPRLGPILLQFPPHVDDSRRDQVLRLLGSLPSHLEYAVEFRSASWISPRTEADLRSLGMTWVAIDHEDHPEFASVPVTSNRIYVRLVGKHGRYDSEDRERFDPTAQLEDWRRRIEGWSLSQITERWILFNNDFAGHAPATLRRFAAMTGRPLPPAAVLPTDRQLRLFD